MSINWSSAMRRGLRTGLPDAVTPSSKALIENIRTTPSRIGGIDSIISKLPFKINLGELHINVRRWADLHPHLRLGNLKRLLDQASIPSAGVRGTDQAALKSMLKKIHPEFQVEKLRTLTENVRKVHPDVNIIINSADQLRQLPAPTQAKIRSAWDKIKIAAGSAAVAVGTIAILKVGMDFYGSVAEAVRQRNGCWLLTKTGENESDVVSCKVIHKSCGDWKTATNPCTPDFLTRVGEVPLNAYYLVREAKADADLRKRLSEYDISLSKITWESTAEDTILSENLTKLDAFLEEFGSSLTLKRDPCAGETTARCVMCMPTASRDSKDFVHTSQLPARSTYQCITNSTVLDVLEDVANGLGVKIWEGIGFVGKVILTVLAYASIVVVIIAMAYFLFTRWLSSTNKGSDEEKVKLIPPPS